MNSTLESAEDAGTFFTSQATARILENVGFTNATGRCINILSDMMAKYFEGLCRDAKEVAEHSGRTELNISDVDKAFRSKHVKMHELQDYMKQVQSFAFEKKVPQFPLSKPSDARGPISMKELAQRLEEEFPPFLPAMHRDWVEEEQPRPSRPTASTSKASEQQPSTSQQLIDIKIEDTALREPSQVAKNVPRKGNKIRATTFPCFVGKSIRDLGFSVIRPPQPVRKVSPSPPVIIESRDEVLVENIPRIPVTAHIPKMEPITDEIKPPESILTEKQPKEHKKERSKKKKKDKDRERERDKEKEKRDKVKHHHKQRLASQEDMVSSSTGPRVVDADTTVSPDTSFTDVKPSTSEQSIWAADSSAPSEMPPIQISLDPSAFRIPDNNEDSNTQPFVQGVPLSTSEPMPTTFPPGLSMDDDVAKEPEQFVPTGIDPEMPLIELFSTPQKSPSKDKKKKKEHKTKEEKAQRKKEKEDKKRKRLEEALMAPLPLPPIFIKKPAEHQPPKSITPSELPRPLITPIKTPEPIVVEKEKNLEAPPIEVMLGKFDHFPLPIIETKEKDKEKKKKKNDDERKKKKDDRKRKHDGDENSHHHKKKKKKHDQEVVPFVEEPPKIPKLKITFKGFGNQVASASSPEPSPIRKSAEQQLVAPLKIPRPPQTVPASEHIQPPETENVSLKTSPEKPLKFNFFGKTTPELPKPKLSHFQKKSPEENARESITPTKIHSESVVIPGAKIQSESKKKEKSNPVPNKNSPPEMVKVHVQERPSAVGMPPSASIKLASKNGKPKADKISPSIKKKSAKQNSVDKGKAEKPKKEKKKTDTNFLFSDMIKVDKAPVVAANEEDDKVWICPVCSVAYAEGADMVACDGCEEWFHWHCVGLLCAPPDDEKWFCPECVKKKAKKEDAKIRKKSSGALSTGGKEKKKVK